MRASGSGVTRSGGRAGGSIRPCWRLQAMRGVQFTTAVGMLAELGDLSRFEHPRQLMAWLGVTPSEHSSGRQATPGQHHQDRQQLCKKAAGRGRLELPAPGTREPGHPARHEGIPKAIIDRAWDAQVRLCRDTASSPHVARTPTLRSWPSPVNWRASSGTSVAWRCRSRYRGAPGNQHNAPRPTTTSQHSDEFPEGGVARYSSNPRRNSATDISRFAALRKRQAHETDHCNAVANPRISA